MLTLLEFGSVWFYVFLGIMSIFITMCVASDDVVGTWATICVIVSFTVLYFLGCRTELTGLLNHITHHPFETLALFFLYIFIGVLWSFAEWYWFVRKKLTDGFNRSTKPSKPNINQEKGRIFTWIFYWPWTMLWKVIHKPFERLFDQIMRWTRKTYEKIVDNLYIHMEGENKSKK